MTKTGVVMTCAHADPSVSNERFNWLGDFLYDLKPDFVWDLGDGADMRSLNSYDTTKPTMIVGQSYEGDIDTYNDAQERIRWRFRRAKKKSPDFFGLMGNHEYRILKAIEADPRLQGNRVGISLGHLNLNKWFNDYWCYENSAPAITNHRGIDYAHFIGSGNYGTAISGEHHAYNLLKKRMRSVCVGHSHKLNIYFRHDANAIGLVGGCFKGAKEHWAGQANDEWASGVMVMHQQENGTYDPEWVSLKRLENLYGGTNGLRG